MSKYVNPTAQDAELAAITAGSNILHFCSAIPANYAGIAAVTLANVAPTFTGPAAGSPNGRQVSVDAKSGVAVTGNGSATHAVLANSSTSTLWYVTDYTGVAVTAGGTLSSTAFVINAANPV